jgi:hypothetical protein
VTGDVKSEGQGAARQVEGAMQDVYGQAKDAATSATEAIGEKASEAEDFVRDTVETPVHRCCRRLGGRKSIVDAFGGAWIILGNPPSRAKALELAARRSCFVVRA